MSIRSLVLTFSIFILITTSTGCASYFSRFSPPIKQEVNVILKENDFEIIETNLSERQEVYQELVDVWEKTRLPKGLSTDDKEFIHRQDRARHFAFRRADMSYLICDEELLGLEEYKEKLLKYMDYYKQTYLD